MDKIEEACVQGLVRRVSSNCLRFGLRWPISISISEEIHVDQGGVESMCWSGYMLKTETYVICKDTVSSLNTRVWFKYKRMNLVIGMYR